MSTAARRAEKREAARDNYAARAAVEAKREEEEMDRMLDAVQIEDYANDFNDDQQRALARMFMRLCK
jgi:hypothetical protein